jgi:hypothetical protein
MTMHETWAADLREDHKMAPDLSISNLRHLRDDNLVEFLTSDGVWHVVESDAIVLTINR